MIKSLRLYIVAYFVKIFSYFFFYIKFTLNLLILLVEWDEEYNMTSEGCLSVDQMDECQQNNQNTSLIQPTISTQIPSSHSLTSNSTNNGNR